MKKYILLFGVFCTSLFAQTTPPDVKPLAPEKLTITAAEHDMVVKERDALKTQVADLTRQVEATNQIVAMLQEQRAFWNKTASDLEIQGRLVQAQLAEAQKQLTEAKKPVAPPVPEKPAKK